MYLVSSNGNMDLYLLDEATYEITKITKNKFIKKCLAGDISVKNFDVSLLDKDDCDKLELHPGGNKSESHILNNEGKRVKCVTFSTNYPDAKKLITDKFIIIQDGYTKVLWHKGYTYKIKYSLDGTTFNGMQIPDYVDNMPLFYGIYDGSLVFFFRRLNPLALSPQTVKAICSKGRVSFVYGIIPTDVFKNVGVKQTLEEFKKEVIFE